MVAALRAAFLSALVFSGKLAAALTVQSSTRFRARERRSLRRLRQYSFQDFVKEFGRSYQPGTEEWALREGHFNSSLQEILDFQAGPTRSWSKGVTKFMDYGEQEFKAMLGYRGRGSRSVAAAALPREPFELLDRNQPAALPARVMLEHSMSSLVGIVRDQGSCGSCWAEAATAVLEGAMAANATALKLMTNALNGAQDQATLSSQAVVSCTPNPRHCGGKGGCDGATAELAFDMVIERGLPLAVEWPYQSGIGITPSCNDNIFSGVRLGITGYEVLPSNKLLPLKQALYETGAPIAVAVDATGWSFYAGGIYSDTGPLGTGGQFNVNHAVVLMGYQDKGTEESAHWLIKNSWGPGWGENGFIRLEMKDDEESHCGWDTKSHEGIACDGDPDTVWVCGTSGILYDSTYPTGVHVQA